MADTTAGAADAGESPETSPAKRVYDELAVEQKRYSILDVMDRLKKGVKPVTSRLLAVSQVQEGVKVAEIEEDFRAKITNFNKHGANPATTAILTEVTEFNVEEVKITGLLYVIGPYLAHFLEGPTDSLFYVLQNLHPGITNTKIMHISECHGQRATSTWQSFHGGAKNGAPVSGEPNTAQRIFGVYRKFLELHRLPAGQDEHDTAFYKGAADGFPHLEDFAKLMDPVSNPDAFGLDEFLRFYCVGGFANDDFLQSEVLWPAAPPLRYYEPPEN
mmetsp:Transcript_7933/g.19084  ORF Transcript_7933/g.19084 Transcript_7933/m.19084 type:complete len:274 (-) Transcript_7933:371-1192(-)|eukprot:CAMPEP_0178999918 /NCGR_PEP_ID=MMETSP0795-20121207/10365_1 /TAXON_ID=88552 /ORGANISM="Amoebophrya sp., Strain Ameob2" /LENGTH=273 /DNA_ID=CAMNT_0020692821 /DNA_START=351 /DNA_END=1172 /DNA_ORIENTATION=-